MMKVKPINGHPDEHMTCYDADGYEIRAFNGGGRSILIYPPVTGEALAAILVHAAEHLLEMAKKLQP